MKARLQALAVFAGLLCLAPGRSVASRATPDIQAAAEAELLALHQADRRAHYDRNVEALTSNLAEKFTHVADGKIMVDPPGEIRKRFTEYFRNARFTAWDDLEPPIVRASADGRMGWMIVRVKIAYTKTAASGKASSEETTMAWISTYEKRHGKWIHVANASTAAPEEAK
jgi:hypothetical protein